MAGVGGLQPSALGRGTAAGRVTARSGQVPGAPVALALRRWWGHKALAGGRHLGVVSHTAAAFRLGLPLGDSPSPPCIPE